MTVWSRLWRPPAPLVAAAVVGAAALAGCTDEGRPVPAVAVDGAREGARIGTAPAAPRAAVPAPGGAGSAPAGGAGTPFADPQGRFTIDVPTGWLRNDVDEYAGSGLMQTMFREPAPPPGTVVDPSVTVSVLRWPSDLEDARTTLVAELAKVGLQVQLSEPAALADGTPARRLESAGRRTDAYFVEVRRTQVVATRDGALFVVAASSEAAQWTRVESTLRTAVDSLALRA
ncbi:PsbP-related protein [Pseudonocardia lacus]|uniref:PsbP-related protein n=1 Tax=Pseudonocardia lacus TaxID=2835865 RepID=UPI001BDC191E|nr:PsbP-related protein [Pseudonocardia lacus]